jgi:hypothetical protein
LDASHEVRVQLDDPLVARAITYYQAASYGFTYRLLNWPGSDRVTEQ